jgi:hypothetical protein
MQKLCQIENEIDVFLLFALFCGFFGKKRLFQRRAGEIRTMKGKHGAGIITFM